MITSPKTEWPFPKLRLQGVGPPLQAAPHICAFRHRQPARPNSSGDYNDNDFKIRPPILMHG